MNLSRATTILLLTCITALTCWRLYNRVQRNIGRQRLSTLRLWLTVLFLSAFMTLILYSCRANWTAMLTLITGLCSGVALGHHSLRLTKFERTTTGLYYVPTARIGLAVLSLFVALICFRVVQHFIARTVIIRDLLSVVDRPLTLLITGMLIGYYLTYAAGLLRRQQRLSLLDPPVL